MRCDDLLVHASVRGHGRADIARIDVLAVVEPVHHVPRELELSLDLRIRAEIVAAVDEHVVDQAPDFRQRFRRRIGELRLERLPLGLPLVLVESRLVHALCMRAARDPQTRRPVP
jgi:hypothetical protein